MRDQVISKIKALAITGFTVSEELPYEESGVPMYTKNPKRFYVDNTQFDSTPVYQTLGGTNISNTTTSVTVYFAVDAKNPPFQLDNVINSLRGLEDSIELAGTHTRECTISTDYTSDLIVVEVDYRLTRIN